MVGRQPSEELCKLGFGGKAVVLTDKAFGNFGSALRTATPLDQLSWKVCHSWGRQQRCKKEQTFVSLNQGEVCCTQVPYGWGTTIPDCTWVRSFDADSGSLGLGADVRPSDSGLRLADCAWDLPTCSQVSGRQVLSDVQTAED